MRRARHRKSHSLFPSCGLNNQDSRVDPWLSFHWGDATLERAAVQKWNIAEVFTLACTIFWLKVWKSHSDIFVWFVYPAARTRWNVTLPPGFRYTVYFVKGCIAQISCDLNSVTVWMQFTRILLRNNSLQMKRWVVTNLTAFICWVSTSSLLCSANLKNTRSWYICVLHFVVPWSLAYVLALLSSLVKVRSCCYNKALIQPHGVNSKSRICLFSWLFFFSLMYRHSKFSRPYVETIVVAAGVLAVKLLDSF